MSDSTTLRAHRAPVEAVDGEDGAKAIEAAAMEVIAEAARGGVELPEGFAGRVAKAVAARSRSALLRLSWKMYRAGVDHLLADTARDEITAKRVTQTFAKVGKP